jgi:hypothetical protein
MNGDSWKFDVVEAAGLTKTDRTAAFSGLETSSFASLGNRFSFA